jgi:signal transduction histidine kinase
MSCHNDGSSLATPMSSARSILIDSAIAAAAFAGSVMQLAHNGIALGHHGMGNLDLLGVALAALSTAPLVIWRRFPLGVFVVAAGASALLAGLGYSADTILGPIGPIVALFLLTASRDRTSPWTRRTTVLVVVLVATYVGATLAAQATFPGLGHAVLALVGAWFAGDRTRLRREQLAEFRERAVRAEQEAERERLLAVAEERTRIARDLHDSAGHAISVIGVRAGAARLRHHQDPDRSPAALAAIEELARDTVAEIDRLVAGLRDQLASESTPVGLASIDALIAHHAATGLAVTLSSTGEPRPLGGAADQAAYRILQEALTNAARHGAGTAAVAVAFGAAALDLTVTNPVQADGGPRPNGGHGLIGMRERATLLGGSLDTDRANGEFRVRAHIPYGGRRG